MNPVAAGFWAQRNFLKGKLEAKMSFSERWMEEERRRQELGKQLFAAQGGNITSKLMSTTFKYKNTSVATIAQFMVSLGEKPENVSQVLRFSLEAIETMILDQHREFMVTTESEAIEVLGNLGINSSRTRLNKKRIFNNLSFESLGHVSEPLVQLSSLKDVNRSPDFIAAYREFEKSKVQQGKIDLESYNNANTPDPIVNTGFTPQNTEPKNIEPGILVLKESGEYKVIKRSSVRNKGKEEGLVCLKCIEFNKTQLPKRSLKATRAILDFEPKSEIVLCICVSCEELTPHQIVRGNGQDIAVMSLSADEFRKQMLAPCAEEETK
jgi:hypothetical protein